MDWTEIVAKTPRRCLESVEAILQMCTNLGLYVEDYANLEENVMRITHVDLIEEELLKKDRDQALVHLYISPDENPAEQIAFIDEKFRSEGIPATLEVRNVREEDWANNWKQYFKPIRVGDRIIVKPEWEALDAEEPEEAGTKRIVVEINPGMAFGTGSHESTKLCLELLEKYVMPDARVLDLGTGSGILAVASVLLGAQAVLGIDIDEYAVKTAAENAAINEVESKCTFRVGNLLDEVSGTYHVVLANIIADVILRLVGQAADYMEPGAVLICSGIIDDREEEVLRAIQLNNSLSVEKVLRDGVWTAISVRKVEATTTEKAGTTATEKAGITA